MAPAKLSETLFTASVSVVAVLLLLVTTPLVSGWAKVAA